MSQQELNLGILAHVDAGKTTLTERLLYEAGVIDAIGSVDDGTTQTDSLALEQRRGITIRSAVASFAVGDVHVNLIDTPGHPDFIAEVERVLGVLDGAVLVISAVEGVQPQTRILIRALQRLHIPTVLFVNKIDRAGADAERVVAAIGERLTPSIVAMGTVTEPGSRVASSMPASTDDDAFRMRLVELLAERDDELLAAYVESGSVPADRLRTALATQTRQALVHPVFFGSAITGAGVPQLLQEIAALLPPAPAGRDGPPVASVFKIERGVGGEKVAYVRMFAGTIRTRAVLRFGRGHEGKVTSISVFERGGAVQRPAVAAGAVAKLWGLAEIQVGDRIGDGAADAPAHHFAPPTLESDVAATNPADGARLRAALAQLAEQDPLISVRRDADGGLSVSLYGEVQKEVLESTLVDEYGLGVTFQEATPLYVERPVATGEAVEVLHAETNPFRATIGLRVEPAPAGSGIAFRLEVDHTGVPLYVYKRMEHFADSMAEYVRRAFDSGRFGWRVTDCLVALTRSGYSVPDGPPSRRGPLSTAADFRKLTPLVLAQALERAGTVVCEPFVRVAVELPTDALAGVTAFAGRLGAAIEARQLRPGLSAVETVVSALAARDLQRRLPGLTGGEGVLESSFAGYRPVAGDPPVRPRHAAATRT
ncbi:MAG TPA: translation factor GTPase family protein [Gaiellaceae bacterium]